MKIDQLETPYLYLDEDGGEEMGGVAIHPAYLKTHVPAALPTGAPGPYKMQVRELKEALALVETDEDGLARFSRPKWSHSEGFELQRQARARAPSHCESSVACLMLA